MAEKFPSEKGAEWLYAVCMRADLGLLDLMRMQAKLPGLLLYSVLIGGYDGNALLQRGSVGSLLGPATGHAGNYSLNFTRDPYDPTRVIFPPFTFCWNQLPWGTLQRRRSQCLHNST